MAEAEATQRPALSTQDTLDASQLSGTMSIGRPDVFRADRSPTMEGSTGSAVLFKIQDAGPPDSGSEAAIEDEHQDEDKLEPYDDFEPDSNTLTANNLTSPEDNLVPANGQFIDLPEMRRPVETNGKPFQRKRDSIKVRLEKTDRKGRYILTADDPDIKEILRKGLEREALEASDMKSRVRFRDMVFTKQFSTFDRQNPASAESPFFGFFTLFWIAMVLIFFQTSMHNYRDYGSILGANQMMKMMFSRDVLVLGITDGLMCVAIFQGYFFQKLVQKGYIRWAGSGWILQNLWQTAYLAAVVGWAYFRDWPWTHTIFAVLHGLVFVMKQHSYAFYNGYLSGVYRRRELLERKLRLLQEMEPVTSPPSSPHTSQRIDPAGPDTDLSELANRIDPTLSKRRPSMGPKTGTDLRSEKSDVASVAAAIESGSPISIKQMRTFEQVIHLEIADLTKELNGKCTSGANAYPQNLRLSNLAEFICLPTLVYELEYPRQDTINWWYVLEKVSATFGVLFVMMVISQAFIYPAVVKTVRMKQAGMAIEERWREFPFIVSDILFPLLIEQLLTWYLIWECILNVLAELTMFADRGFYGDWWNSVTWDHYARAWNVPVHNFLLRHVYHSSISSFHLSRTTATFVTFLLSALVHEMCMAILFKKVRGYLFMMQLMQMPLVMVSRSKYIKGRTVLGNVVFWTGLFIGPSVLTSLYLII